MSATWPSGLEANDFLAGGGLYNLGQILWDRDLCATQKQTSSLFPTVGFTGLSGQLVARMEFDAPSYMFENSSIGWMFQPYIDTNASGWFKLQLRNASTGSLIATGADVIASSSTAGWLTPIEPVYHISGSEIANTRIWVDIIATTMPGKQVGLTCDNIGANFGYGRLTEG